jgi:predicted small secreted protein
MKNEITRTDDLRTGKSMKKLIILALAIAALAGCNTVAGVGEDVSAGARTVQDTF